MADEKKKMPDEEEQKSPPAPEEKSEPPKAENPPDAFRARLRRGTGV